MAALCSTTAYSCIPITDSRSHSFSPRKRVSFYSTCRSLRTSPLARTVCSDVSILLSCRFSGAVAAKISKEKMEGSTSFARDAFKLTYLEGNSWLWDVGGLKFLVDPVLVGNLDFGFPWLFDGARKVLKGFQPSSLSDVDWLLITQSLDDHCHLNTLKVLSQMFKNLKVIAPPNAKSKLASLFRSVMYLEPGQSFEAVSGNGSKVRVQATAGPVLGPPWQLPENGYLIKSLQNGFTLYHEPHCVYDKQQLPKEQVDIIITPVIKQRLLQFSLVSGQEDAVELVRRLNAKFVVPMNNGDLDAKGLLAALLRVEGNVYTFKELLRKEMPETKVLEPTPGVPLEISPAYLELQ